METVVLEPFEGRKQTKGFTPLAWLVAPGDKVAPGSPLLEVSTGRKTLVVTARRPGKVKELLLPLEGQKVALGVPLLTLESLPLLERNFPKLKAGEYPGEVMLKKRVVELHKLGEEEEAKELLEWWDKRSKKKQNISALVIVVLVVLASALGFLWFSGAAEKAVGSNVTVCIKNGQALEGDACGY